MPAPQMTPSLEDRLLFAGTRSGALEPLACRALRKAVHLLGFLLAHRIQELRGSSDPIMRAQGAVEEQTALVRAHSEIADLLGRRWDKIPDKNRPHYTPSQRFRILRVKQIIGLSVQDAAHLFRVAPGTIARWQTEAAGHPDRTTVGTTVRPAPPLRRYADVVAHTVQAMALLGFGGYESIAQILARAGWRIGRTTVSRYLKKPKLKPLPPLEPQPHAAPGLRARHVNHVWLMDFTPVTALFGLRQFTVGTVLDAYSRFPLATQVFEREPTADQAVGLLQAAVRHHGKPRHFISDQGPQFTAQLFGDALKLQGITQRFGAIGKHGSIALIERFFRTLKDALGVRVCRPLLRNDLEGRLAPALQHYCAHRPHTALGGATPAEVYFGIDRASSRARHPPRGQPGEANSAIPFKIRFLDPERRFPVLEDIAA